MVIKREYINIDGTKVELEYKEKKKKKKSKRVKEVLYVGKKCTYVGYTRDTGRRIVYYKGKILEDLGETIKVEFKDQDIRYNDNKIVKIVPKKVIKLYYD